MGSGADSADSWCDSGHFLGWAADGELFESAELGNLQNGAVDITFVIQEDLDFSVPFQSCYRVNGDSLTHFTVSNLLRLKIEVGRLNR